MYTVSVRVGPVHSIPGPIHLAQTHIGRTRNSVLCTQYTQARTNRQKSIKLVQNRKYRQKPIQITQLIELSINVLFSTERILCGWVLHCYGIIA